MAAFNFPASPSNGDTYTLNSVTYQWDGTKWVRYSAAVGAQGSTGPTGPTGAQGAQGHQGLQGAQAHISASAPSSGVNNGDLWWESDTGDLAIYYNDGSSSQWIDINTGPRGAQGATGPTGAQGATAAQGAQGAARQVFRLGHLESHLRHDFSQGRGLAGARRQVWLARAKGRRDHCRVLRDARLWRSASTRPDCRPGASCSPCCGAQFSSCASASKEPRRRNVGDARRHQGRVPLYHDREGRGHLPRGLSS